GNVFIADEANNRIRQINADGIITTVAGNGVAGFEGDGGTATSAELDLPIGVALDSQGNLLIADDDNNRIRKVSGIQGPTLTLNNLTAANAGDYQVVVTGIDGGSVTSSVAVLTLESTLTWTHPAPVAYGTAL